MTTVGLTTNLHNYRRPHIILGVTGSVAAVKAPELALKLVNELNAQVKVLLTQGGYNFWNKAQDYDPKNWKLIQEAMFKEPGTVSLIHVIGKYSTNVSLLNCIVLFCAVVYFVQ